MIANNLNQPPRVHRARCAWCNQSEPQSSLDQSGACENETIQNETIRTIADSDSQVAGSLEKSGDHETHVICVPCLEATLAEWREHVASRSESGRRALSAC